ncbi:c-type cytochrome [Brevundimonas subvibrioides]|uniref:c-type cytochrome n=1 Tax=Brevundimonas subvibrioides TaxID=74313 RepID=UPI0022B42C6F|nr:cytochrome c [Brevundimonas subvibrioides]
MKHLVAIAMLLGLTGCAVQPTAPLSQQAWIDTSLPDVAAQQRGAAYARANCAGCHAVGTTGDSPLPAAPHFRDLGRRYPVEYLAEAFAEGINTAHAEMPEFVMSTEENSDLVAYLKSIQPSGTE